MEILRISKDETFFRKRQARNADEVDDVQPSSKAGSGGREKSEKRNARNAKLELITTRERLYGIAPSTI